jgi:FtsP/CotA-like multicopper oxidase with cupredoxin domain/peroxiredoxin
MTSPIRIVIVLAVACVVSPAPFAAQGPVPKSGAKKLPTAAEPLNAFVGKWTYRSFRSDPSPATEPNDLLFGIGTLELTSVSPDRVDGTIGGDGWQLAVVGRLESSAPGDVRFQGKGMINGEEWVYDYIGYLVPSWPGGIDQRPAIVGSVIRSKNHSQGAAKAGYVAQWIAVRQDPVAVPRQKVVPGASAPADLYRQRTRERYLQDPKDPARSLLLAPAGAPRAAPRSSLEPSTVRSAAGRLDVTLTVDYATLQIGQDPVRLRTYNSQLVGPVLRAKAGDTLFITLVNRLPVEPAAPHVPNSHHEWNTTNLHFHGLHVAPQGMPDAESDNVLLELKPSEPFDPTVSVKKYQVRIPANHPAGTFWYHAHKHGAVSAQVSSGMAGALIIERDDNTTNLDRVPEIAAAREEILLLQQISYLRPGVAPNRPPGTIEQSPGGTGANEDQMFAPGSWDVLRRYVTVNGLKIPTITLAQGEVRRLRLIASGQREAMRLQLVQSSGTGPAALKFYEIAVDGLPTGGIRELDTVELAPGYRSDVLIHPPDGTSGEYYLVDSNAPPGTGADGSPEPLRHVARIVVAGSSAGMTRPLPAALRPHRLADLDATAATTTQHAFYGLVFPPNDIKFSISRDNLAPGQVPAGQEFSMSAPRLLTLGKTERWLVGTRNGSGVGQFHPFHIHTNSFLITRVKDESDVDVTERELGFRSLWRDTLAMKQGYTYELLTRYDDFTGTFVQHCHILDHEDNGMMELVRIDPPGGLPPRGGNAPPTRNRVLRAIPPTKDEPSVLCFVQGSACPHCMAQVTDLAAKLAGRKVQVVVVSASAEDDLQKFPALPFVMVSDPELKYFKEHGAYDGKPRHATIVRDRAGRELLRRVADEPFMDSKAILATLVPELPRYVIGVNGTDTTTDDYLTWSPMRCQIRMENGTRGGPDVEVALSNDDRSVNLDGGDIRFAKTLDAGETAMLETLTLQVKQDGTPTDFFLAGSKASRLTEASLLKGGRDAVIEVWEGGLGGRRVGAAAVMVRIRKNYATLNALEKREFLKAMVSLRDMQDAAKDRFEPLVYMHKLAAMNREPGFDQAHISSGFLPWHRAFLLVLERELQKEYPHVALPYWLMDQPPAHFTPDDLGNNYDPDTNTTREEVVLAASNPLYGWKVRFDNMGRLVRAPGDHVRISLGAPYRSSSALNTHPDVGGAFRPFRRLLEGNPHNIGHNNSGAWMAACLTSPGDPLFWIFHCQHDHLWAQWQRQYNRFDTSGMDEAHYYPKGQYSKDAAPGERRDFPLGHHLKDKMWPWDETMGQQFEGDMYSTRPARKLSKFPKAPTAGLWPSDETSPMCADMIDYLGLASGRLPHGFAYDDTPFGAAPLRAALMERPIVQGRRNLFLDPGASEANRLDAARQLSHLDFERHPELLTEVLKDKGTTAAVKARALTLLAQVAPADALKRSVEAAKGPDAGLAGAAVKELVRMHNFGELSGVTREDIYKALQDLAGGEASPQAQGIALDFFASHADPRVIPLLRQLMNDHLKSPLPLRRLVALSRQYRELRPLVRPLLERKQEELAVAALWALEGDEDTLVRRLEMVRSKTTDQGVRRAALRGTMTDTPDALAAQMTIVTDSGESDELRAEAAAGVRVTVGAYRRILGDKVAEAEKVLMALRLTPGSELAKAVELTLERIREAKK